MTRGRAKARKMLPDRQSDAGEWGVVGDVDRRGDESV